MKFIVTEDKQFLKLVDGTENEFQQLKTSFTRPIENARFRKKKFHGWDGNIIFFDSKMRIPFGLWDKLYELAEKYKFQIEIDGLDTIIDFEFDELDYLNWEKDFFKDSEKKPRPFQSKTVIEILKWKRSISEIATSSGKTLIVFCVFAYLKQKHKLNRMLMVVPSISLVTQGINDFEEYSNEKQLLNYKVQAIGGGNDKAKKDVDIIIGTFQTLRDMDRSFFDGIDVIAIDECHTVKTVSLKNILSKVTANIRFGLSGTTGTTGKRSKYADAYTVQALLGPLVNKITPDFIIKKGWATPVNVRILYLNYLSDELKETLYKIRSKGNNDGSKMLRMERELILENNIRFEFIVNMISRVTKNSIVFFTDIKNGYGKKIYNRLLQTCSNNYKIMYIDGKTNSYIRDEYKAIMDNDDKIIKILVASFGTFSTGISMNNVHNIFLCESYKSQRIIKQTIGRGMRLHQSKSILNIIDYVDNFMFKGHKNFMVSHSIEREEIYKEEKFKFEKFQVNLNI